MFNSIILIFIAIFISISPLYSGTIEIDQKMKEISIGSFLEYIEDENGQLKFEDVRSNKYKSKWISSDTDNPGFGFTESVYWVRFALNNISEKETKLYLEHGYPLVDKIAIYISDEKTFRVIETGDDYVFSRRPLKHRKFIFPIKVPAKSSIICHLRIKSDSSMIIALKLWAPDVFTENSIIEYRLLTIFYGGMLIMILYNFFIFVFIRRVVYLFYTLFILFLLLLIMAMNGTAYEFLWPESPWLVNFSIPILMLLVLTFLSFFGVELVELRSRRNESSYRQRLFIATLVLFSIGIPILILDLILPYRYMIIVSTVWTGIVIASIFIFIILLIIKEKSKLAYIGLSAGFCFLIGVFVYVLKTLSILPSSFITDWLLYIGTAVMLVIFSNAIAYRINRLDREIIAAEKKYRRLVESSDDIIFALDKNLNFLSANRSLGKHLGFWLDDVIGRSLLEFIHESGGTQEYSKIVVKDFIRELRKTRKSVSFKLDFITSFSHEPKSFSLKLEYIGSKGAPERFLGKASLIEDDKMLEYVESEQHSYKIDNYLNTAELLGHRLTKNLAKYFESSEIAKIRISLREVLINAIEHGNLNVLFDEKSQVLSEGRYLDFIQERQNDPNYKDRTIIVDYTCDNKKVIYKVTDEGDGFDSDTMMKQCTERSQNEMLSHGRGLVMVSNTFDEMTFNEKGNQILLVKYFDQTE